LQPYYFNYVILQLCCFIYDSRNYFVCLAKKLDASNEMNLRCFIGINVISNEVWWLWTSFHETKMVHCILQTHFVVIITLGLWPKLRQGKMKIGWKQAKARDTPEIHYVNQRELSKWTHILRVRSFEMFWIFGMKVQVVS